VACAPRRPLGTLTRDRDPSGRTGYRAWTRAGEPVQVAGLWRWRRRGDAAAASGCPATASPAVAPPPARPATAAARTRPQRRGYGRSTGPASAATAPWTAKAVTADDRRPRARAPAGGPLPRRRAAGTGAGRLGRLGPAGVVGRPPPHRPAPPRGPGPGEPAAPCGQGRIQAQAEASRRLGAKAPVPASVDPAQALRSWIAAQPWARSGPQGWVYLLCFRDPATGEHRPLQGPGCRGQCAGHHWGKPASSGLLQPCLCAGSRESVATGRRRGLSAPPRPRGTTQTGSAAPTGSW